MRYDIYIYIYIYIYVIRRLKVNICESPSVALMLYSFSFLQHRVANHEQTNNKQVYIYIFFFTSYTTIVKLTKLSATN